MVSIGGAKGGSVTTARMDRESSADLDKSIYFFVISTADVSCCFPYYDTGTSIRVLYDRMILTCYNSEIFSFCTVSAQKMDLIDLFPFDASSFPTGMMRVEKNSSVGLRVR